VSKPKDLFVLESRCSIPDRHYSKLEAAYEDMQINDELIHYRAVTKDPTIPLRDYPTEIEELKKEVEAIYCNNPTCKITTKHKNVWCDHVIHRGLRKPNEELRTKLKIACEALEKVKHNGCCLVCSESCPSCNAHMALAKIRGDK
jgi:hypothetical protein